jgi:hypothetical protein
MPVLTVPTKSYVNKPNRAMPSASAIAS